MIKVRVSQRSDDGLPPGGQAAAAAEAPSQGWTRLWYSFRRNLTPRLASTLALWRVEARLSTPLALAAVAGLGRWPAALAIGVLAAVLSALFLFLLEGERAVAELRVWAERQGFVRRFLLPIADRQDRTGTVLRLLALPLLVLLLGPFWRGLTLVLFRIQGVKAYLITVLGSIPHALLWVGLVLGGIWEGLLWPFIESHF
ncbi:MAG: hypothetical protein ACUVV3_07690 [Dehalococcoidia bacterium]